MENYGNYQRRPAAPHITWRHSNGNNVTTNDVGFAHAARKLCAHLRPNLTRESPYYVPVDFLVMFKSGNILDVWAFARNLIRRDMSSDELMPNIRLHTSIVAFMNELPEMKSYGHFSEMPELFMAWSLSQKDPLCASEIFMDSLEEIPSDSLESLRQSGRPPGGPMQSEVTAHLATYLDGNRDIAVADLRLRYPASQAVQQWLDTVQDILS